MGRLNYDALGIILADQRLRNLIIADGAIRTDRTDAKLGWRDPVKLAWANRTDPQPSRQPDAADVQ